MSKKDDQIIEEESKDSKEITEEDLAKVKAEAESKEEVDDESQDESSEDDDKGGDEEESESKDETPDFQKKFPNIKGDTPEEYLKNLETTYENSFAELHRLRQSKEDEAPPAKEDASNPALTYAEQLYQQETNKAWELLREKYPQVQDLDNFKKFEQAAGSVASTLSVIKGFPPTLSEVYIKTAQDLGWKAADAGEDLGAAVKKSASSSKATGSTKKASASKVTDEQVKLGRKFFPGKSDEEIRKELEEQL